VTPQVISSSSETARPLPGSCGRGGWRSLRVIAAWILGARKAIPIHAEGYEIDGIYQPVPDAAKRFAAAAAERDVPVRILDPGESIDITAAETNQPTGD
jgi:L-ascorbate metabolism protein UlaG (beta-lactamase superfamily)